jgi:ferredoxin
VEAGAYRPVSRAPSGDVVTGDATGPAKWRVEVSKDCVGSGMCVMTAPRYFDLVGGHSRPRQREVEADETVAAAADLCPMTAIEVFDAATGAGVAP